MPPAVRAVLIPIVLTLAFVAAFLVPGHDPRPNGLPVVAVAGVLPAAAAGDLAEQDIEVTTVPDRAAAVRAVRDRDAYGAFVAGSTRKPKLLLASGASFPAFTALAATMLVDRPMDFDDLAPMAEGDPRGVALNLLVLPLVITAIIGSLLLTQLLPGLALRGRVPLTALIGALGGTGAVGLAHALDAVSGSLPAEAGLVALMVLGVGLTSGAIVRALGPPALLVAFLLFLVVGIPASGLSSAPELLPTPWKEVGALLPPGALGDALRGVAYFDGAAIGGSVVVLLAWVAIGAGAHAALDVRARRA